MATAIEQFVKPNQVFIGIEVGSKREALEFLAQRAAKLGIGMSSDDILKAFLDREEMGTTGMEAGLAIPHAKSDVIDHPAVCLVKFATPVEWESMDGEPVTVAVALFVPGGEAGTTHVRLLSRVAVLASRDDFASFITECDDPVEIAAYLSEGIKL